MQVKREATPGAARSYFLHAPLCGTIGHAATRAEVPIYADGGDVKKRRQLEKPQFLGTILRHINLALSTIMLTVSFRPPQSAWNIEFTVSGRTVEANAFHWLFMISLLSYIPLMISGAALFAYDLAASIKTRSRNDIFKFVFFSSITLLALYRLNNWVFTKIF